MLNYITSVHHKVNIDDGKGVIKKILMDIYLNQGISNKELARLNKLPIPIVVAIKKEFKKLKIVKQNNGIRLTDKGMGYVEDTLGLKGLNQLLYQNLLTQSDQFIIELREKLQVIYDNRPLADVTIDQTKCSIVTSLKRAILCLQNNHIIGTNILCVGDDDLVSVAIGFLLKHLYQDMTYCKTNIVVLDIDKRIIDYITKISDCYELPITCIHHDLRKPLDVKIQYKFDCVFTDPPYTLQGLNLFLSRAIEGIKKDSGYQIYLSFANKPLSFEFKMQKYFIQMGLIVSNIYQSFNQYEGAGIIGNIGQMIILKTTSSTTSLIKNTYHDNLYTGDLKNITRLYTCQSCQTIIRVGKDERIKTIEELKSLGCPKCSHHVFDIKRHKEKDYF